MKLSRKQLEWASESFSGIPAFILGNGPTLPEDLSCLDGLFTVGVNRILLRHDPVVLMWYDTNIFREMQTEFRACKALLLTATRTATLGKTVGLRTVGNMEAPHVAMPPNPSYIGVTGSSGVSAAFWARRLGCGPVYLLGMSGTVQGDKTDFYGVNEYHNEDSLGIIDTRTRALLENEWAIPIATQEELNELANGLRFATRPREEYIRIIASVHPGKRAKATGQPPPDAEDPLHGWGKSDSAVGVCPNCHHMGRFDRIHGQQPSD